MKSEGWRMLAWDGPLPSRLRFVRKSGHEFGKYFLGSWKPYGRCGSVPAERLRGSRIRLERPLSDTYACRSWACAARHMRSRCRLKSFSACFLPRLAPTRAIYPARWSALADQKHPAAAPFFPSGAADGVTSTVPIAASIAASSWYLAACPLPARQAIRICRPPPSK